MWRKFTTRSVADKLKISPHASSKCKHTNILSYIANLCKTDHRISLRIFNAVLTLQKVLTCGHKHFCQSCKSFINGATDNGILLLLREHHWWRRAAWALAGPGVPHTTVSCLPPACYLIWYQTLIVYISRIDIGFSFNCLGVYMRLSTVQKPLGKSTTMKQTDRIFEVF